MSLFGFSLSSLPAARRRFQNGTGRFTQEPRVSLRDDKRTRSFPRAAPILEIISASKKPTSIATLKPILRMLQGGRDKVLADSKNAEECWPAVKAHYEKHYRTIFTVKLKDQQILWLHEQMLKLSSSFRDHVDRNQDSRAKWRR